MLILKKKKKEENISILLKHLEIVVHKHIEMVVKKMKIAAFY